MILAIHHASHDLIKGREQHQVLNYRKWLLIGNGVTQGLIEKEVRKWRLSTFLRNLPTSIT